MQALLVLSGLATAATAAHCGAQCVGPRCDARYPQQGSNLLTTAPEGVARVAVRAVSGVRYGTAALVATEGSSSYLVTCHHLLAEGGSGVFVAFPGGEWRRAQIEKVDERHDLALLRTAAGTNRPLKFQFTTPTGLLTAGGLGGDGRYRAIKGPIVGYATPAGAASPSVRIGGAVRSGDSGGPVLNQVGELVGIVWGVRGGVTYATVGEPLRELVTPATETPGAGMARVRPPRDESRDPNKGSQPTPEAVSGSRIAELEQRFSALKACRCVGECVSRSELRRYAERTEFIELRSRSEARHADLLTRVRAVARDSAEQARQTAVATVRERLTERAASLRSLTTAQIVAGALGVGGPAGLAVLAIGLLARRRSRTNRPRRGAGGPRREPFRGGR